MRKPIIAIDGPAGAGKSTIARAVAERLGYVYIDTGAMYRAVAAKVIENGISPSDAAAVTALAGKLDIRFVKCNGEQRLFVDGEDLTDAVRSPEATRLSSPVSAIQGVRKKMVDLQRRMAADGGVVMEGRDIGTVVFPDADVKIFLTASAAERARRRAAELREKGIEVEVEQVEAEIKERDLRDSSRRHAPLKQAPDAVLIDTDNMTPEQVVEAIIRIHDERAEKGCSTA